MGREVFISYSAEDKLTAEAVCKDESVGVGCWVAPRDVLPGMNWAEGVMSAIHESRLMVLVFSSHANASQQVVQELERGVHLGLPIVPVRIEEVEPTGAFEYFIGSRHWLDALIPPFERHLEQLVHTVQQLLQSRDESPADSVTVSRRGTPGAVSQKSRPEPRCSYGRLAWAGAVALLAVGLLWLVRAPIVTWVALNLPRVLGASVEQQIAFAETSDGVRIAYATSGGGPPIVFVLGWASHLTKGLGSPLYDPSGYLAWYSRDHLVVRYDGRGFGLSDRDVTDFSLDARVRDVETVVDALGVESFVLYAFSTGGPIGVAYAVRHPERVSRLVLAATWASTDPEPRRMIGDLFEFAGANWETAAARASLVEFLAPEASNVERRLLLHFLKVAGDGPQFQAFMASRVDIDVTEQARRIRVPTLVVAGDADKTVPLPASRRLASLIPGARFEVIEGASHRGAAVDDPRVMRLVSDFLAEDASGAQ